MRNRLNKLSYFLKIASEDEDPITSKSRLDRLDHLLKLASKLGPENKRSPYKAIFKVAGEFEGQCKIYNVEEDYEGEALEEEGLDYYKILDDIENLFEAVGIRISRNEGFYEACINQDGKVMGASVLSKEIYNGEPKLRFSVAVSPEAQGKGVGRFLTESIVNENKAEWAIEAWVVNPNMAKLLETLGFEVLGGGDWSQHNPIMELPGSGSLGWLN